MPGSYDIGPKIGMDGEAEFRKSLQNINQQLKTLGSEMKLVTSAFNDNDKSMDKLGSENSVLTRQIATQERALAQLRQGLIASTAKYGEADSRTQKWQQTVNTATTRLNRMKSQLAANEKAMDEFGKETEDVSENLEDASKAGLSFGDVLKANIISDAVLSGVRALADGFKSMISSAIGYNATIEGYQTSFEVMTGSAQEAKAVVEELTDFAAKTPFEMQDLAETVQLLMNYGFAADEAMDRMSMLGDIAQGDAEKMNRIATAYGQMSSAGKVQLEDIKQMIEAGFNPLQEISETTGESMESLYERISDGAVAVDEITASMQRSTAEGGRYFQSMDKQAQTFNGQISSLRDNIDQALGGAFRSVSDELTTSILPAINTAISSINVDAISQTVGGVVKELSTIGDAFQTGGLTGALQQTLTVFTQFGGQAVQAIGNGIMAAVPEIASAAVSLMGQLGGYLVENLPTLMQAGLEAVKEFSGSLRENAGLVVDGALSLAKSLAQGLADSLPTIIENVPAIVSNIANVINENAPKVLVAAGEIILTLAKGLIDAIPVLIQNIPKILQAMWDAFVAFNWVGLGKSIITFVSNGIKSAGAFIQQAAQNIIETFRTSIKQLPKLLVNVGKQVVQGLLNGIKSMGTWLKNQITTFCTGVLDGFLSFFGIHSPSRLMRDRVGVPIIQGVALGMRKGLPEVRETAGQIGSAIEDEISKVNGEIARMEQEETDRQAAEELAEHKKKLAELYDELGRAAWDERQDVLDEIAELQADWDAKQAEEARKAEKEAAQARLEELEAFQERYQDTLDELEEAYQDSYDEITGMQADMAEALAGYGDLFTEADGVVELGDLRSQVNDIRRYGEALKELEGRGISDSLMSEITGMSVEDALAYTEELLGLTDRQYEEYMELWETKQAEAQRVAQEFYASELRALSDEYVNKIPEAVSGLKNEMADLGMDSALGLAEGFASMETSIGNIFTQTIQRAVDAAKAAMGIHSPSTVWRDQVGAMMAQGLADGFTQRLRAVAGNMTAAIPSAADQFGSIAAGVVNGVQTAVAGGGNYRVEIPIIINGREFSRAILPDLRAVEKSNPEVVSGV